MTSNSPSGWEQSRGPGASYSARLGVESRIHSENVGSFILWIQPLFPALVIWVSLLARFDLSLLLAIVLYFAQLTILIAAAKYDRQLLRARGFATFSHPSAALAAFFPFAYLWKRFRLYVERDPDAARPFTRHLFMVAVAAFAVLAAGLWGIPIRLLLSA